LSTGPGAITGKLYQRQGISAPNSDASPGILGFPQLIHSRTDFQLPERMLPLLVFI
jgi:hypothetical protein